MKGPYLRRNLLVLTVVLSAVQSGLIAYGDYRFAEAYRTAAREINAQYARPGRVIWLTGEWGFRYYLEQAGSPVLIPTSTDPDMGDIIVTAESRHALDNPV